MLPNRVQWGPSFGVGDDVIDEQHRRILTQCNRLADLCEADGGNSSADPEFREAYDCLMSLAREHFTAEEARLVADTHPDIEDYRHACAEYDYLAAEIATAENFDKIELQRFVALWWIGHILGDAKRAAQSGAKPT